MIWCSFSVKRKETIFFYYSSQKVEEATLKPMSSLSREAFKQRLENTQWARGRGDANEVAGQKLADLGLGNWGSGKVACFGEGRPTGREKRAAKGEGIPGPARPKSLFGQGQSPFLQRL